MEIYIQLLTASIQVLFKIMFSQQATKQQFIIPSHIKTQSCVTFCLAEQLGLTCAEIFG